MEIALISIAMILGGTLVSDDILNHRLRIGERLAERFSRSATPAPLQDSDGWDAERAKVLTR